MTRTIRILGAALGSFVGLGIAAAGGGLFTGSAYSGLLLAAWTISWMIVGFAVLPYLTIVPAQWLITRVQEMSTAEFVAAVLGLFVGLLLGLLLSLPLAQIEGPLGTWLPLGISLFLGLGMMGLTVAKRQDLIAAAEGAGIIRRPDADAGRREGEPRIVVDTSVLIDGRVADIIESGFIFGTLVVPRFVLEELQHIADSSDTLRRNRGRRGLEMLQRIQRDSRTPVEVVDDEAPGVDRGGRQAGRARQAAQPDHPHQRLQPQPRGGAPGRAGDEHQLARECHEARGPARRGAAACGSSRRARRPGQGVGFLDDGTMIVVEGGARLIDREVEVTVTRVLQTVAGRMIFAQPRVDQG